MTNPKTAETKKTTKKVAAWVRPAYGEQRKTANGSTVMRVKPSTRFQDDNDGTTQFVVLAGGKAESANVEAIGPGQDFWVSDSGKFLTPTDAADLLQMVGEPTFKELEAEVAGLRIL